MSNVTEYETIKNGKNHEGDQVGTQGVEPQRQRGACAYGTMCEQLIIVSHVMMRLATNHQRPAAAAARLFSIIIHHYYFIIIAKQKNHREGEHHGFSLRLSVVPNRKKKHS
eukprot:scaffold2418_cov175-Amphora_coffeaeformis.AAC.3